MFSFNFSPIFFFCLLFLAPGIGLLFFSRPHSFSLVVMGWELVWSCAGCVKWWYSSFSSWATLFHSFPSLVSKKNKKKCYWIECRGIFHKIAKTRKTAKIRQKQKYLNVIEIRMKIECKGILQNITKTRKTAKIRQTQKMFLNVSWIRMKITWKKYIRNFLCKNSQISRPMIIISQFTLGFN